LKIREKALQDNNERTVRLESYIKNLELEKAEYENTIRALKRKIANLEDTKSYTAKEEVNCTSSNNTTYDTNNQSQYFVYLYSFFAHFHLHPISESVYQPVLEYSWLLSCEYLEAMTGYLCHM
jgi:cupin superfamily acireductone dioxygenase involved in methionine salvage